MIETKHTICPLDCPDACALLATVENGIVTGLRGNPEHENTRGFLCRKMRSYYQRVESKERILFPQVRTGKKGEGKFKRISWDEAWRIMVSGLRELKRAHGGEALLPYHYAGNMGHINRSAGAPFFHRFGASRMDPTICSAAHKAGWAAHCGDKPGRDPMEAVRSKTVVAWGINVKVSNVHFWPMIQKCRKAGGRLIVIDPYRNITAKSADHYFQVKPGGDVALALGALKSILENGRENRDFIAQKTTGFETLKQAVTSMRWDVIEQESGIPRDQIVQMAELLLEHPETFMRIGVGLTRNTTGAMSVRAIICLAMALGLFENQPGQGVLHATGSFNTNRDRLEYPQLAERKTRLVNMVQLGHALTALRPKIHGLFVYNSNPLAIAPDASMVKAGLEREDLFTIVHEQVMTPTARYADLLLPATTMLENRDVYDAYGHFTLGTIEPVIPPRGEAIDNFTLFQTLAVKMGYDDPPFIQTIEERIQDYLSDVGGIPTGIDLTKLQSGQYVKSVYADPSRHPSADTPYKFISDTLDASQPVIPCLTSKTEFEDPNLRSRFPFRLITPPTGNLLNSTFGDQYQDNPGAVLIHPADAKERGIETGKPVSLINHRSNAKRVAKVTSDTQRGLLVAEGIYWENSDEDANGINELTSQTTTDLGGGGTFHESLVDITIW